MADWRASLHSKGKVTCAYWYGWAAMTKDLAEIRELARTLRAEKRK